MEKTYWLARKRASLKAAQGAKSSEARLAHYDLAGRYSIKAASVKTAVVFQERTCSQDQWSEEPRFVTASDDE